MTDIVLLDGGMGQELIARSAADPHPTWSARVMLDQPELVQAVHEDFLRAGASVITVNTYAARREQLKKWDMNPHFEALQQTACELAHAARAAVGSDARIAGSLPPLVRSYSPESTLEADLALEQYREMVAIQAPHVDFFLCETMVTGYEAKAAALAASESGKPVLVCYGLADDGRLRSGETVTTAQQLLSGIPVAGLVANCCMPRAVDAALPELLAFSGLAGAYPNAFKDLKPGFLTVDELTARDDFTPEVFAARAMTWADAGARILGGCCEIGPAHIAALHAALVGAGHTITGEITA